ncbi:hypothetical protein, partial [Sutterella sp.]|uniref:hypothetical protein n=1 Tax=Sutterella sp. TaxID=1981025 RepID=UPI003FD89942
MTTKRNARPEGVQQNAPQVKMLLRYPVLTEAQAKKLKGFIAAHDIAGAVHMIKKQGDLTPFSPAICIFFINTFQQLYGSLKLDRFRPLAELAREAALFIEVYGPMHPGWGLLCQTRLLVDVVLGNSAAAMRRTLTPPPVGSMELVTGAPELQLEKLMRNVYPTVILNEATEALEDAVIHDRLTKAAAARFLDLAEATPPLVKHALRWSESFMSVLEFLESLGENLDAIDALWAQKMLHGRYARALSRHCRVARKGADAKSRLSLLSLFSIFADAEPEVVGGLWELLWSAHERVAAKPGNKGAAVYADFWAAGALLCDFLNDPDALKDFDAARTKDWPGRDVFTEILRLRLLDDLAAARELEAAFSELKARLAQDPSDLLAGVAALRLVSAAAGLARGESADRALLERVDRLERMVFELFGDVSVAECNPWGAWAVFILRNGDPVRGSQAQEELVASAALICRSLVRPARWGLKTEGALAAVHALLKHKAEEWVHAGDWERIYDVLRLDDASFPDEAFRRSLFCCARGVLIAKKVIEKGCAGLEEDGFWEDEALEASVRAGQLENVDLPEALLRLELDFVVCAEIAVGLPQEAERTWAKLGCEAGTGIPQAELRRMRLDEEALKAHLEKWIEAAQAFWRGSAGSAAFAQMADAEDEDEEHRLLGLAGECRAGVLENYGNLVPFDFDCKNPEMEQLLLLVRPKVHPERLVCFCFAPVVLGECINAKRSGKSMQAIPRHVLMCEAPATLLETPEGRDDLRLMAAALFASAAALTTDEPASSFVEDSFGLLSGDVLKDWRPFPSEKFWVTSHVPFDEEDVPDADEPRWVEHDGRRLARVVEVFFLNGMEAEWMRRAVTIDADRELDLEKLRLRREHRPSAVDVYSYAGDRESRTLTVRLPKVLRGRTCWVARSIM